MDHLQLKKSTYETLWNLEGEYLDQVCSHPFRHREDVSQYVIREYQKLSGNFIPKNVRKLCRYFNLAETNPTLTDTIIHQKSPVVCMNDSNQEIPYLKVKEEIQRAFEQILPDRSSFERY